MSLPPPTPPSSSRQAARSPHATPPTTPRPSQPATSSASPAVPRQRARDLLRAHYGLDGPASPRTTSTAADVPDKKDPMDLDSTSFDPHVYYTSLIKTSSLPALIKQENDLHSQIRLLDSERHALVYNRYGDLVSASDLIQKMNAHTSPLSDSLDQIRDSFSTISQLSSSVSLPPPNPTQTTARTVREVADLPERISDLLALGRVKDAEYVFDRARTLLDAWSDGGVKGAQEVRDECERLLKSSGEAGEVGTPP